MYSTGSFRTHSSRGLGRPLKNWERLDEDSALPVPSYMRVLQPSKSTFQFSAQRIRIDWRLLHGVEVARVIGNTDLDTLDQLVPVLAFGDLEAEDPLQLTETNFFNIFRLSQLAIEYLLYVQDTLAGIAKQLNEESLQIGDHLTACRIRIREQDANLKLHRREIRQTRRTLRAYEALTANTRIGNTPPKPNWNEESSTSKHTAFPIHNTKACGEEAPLQTVLRECETLRNERQNLQEQIRQMNASLEKMKGGTQFNDTGGTARSSMDRSVVFNLEVNQQLKRKLKQANDQLRALGESKSDAQLKVVELTRKLAAMEKENIVLKERTHSWHPQTSGTSDVSQTTPPTMELENALKLNMELSGKLMDAQNQLNDSQKRAKELERTLEKENAAGSGRTCENLEVAQELDKLKGELAKAQDIKKSDTKEVRKLRRENTELRSEIDSLRDTPGETREVGDKIVRDWKMEEIDRLNAENEMLRKRNVELENDVKNLKGQLGANQVAENPIHLEASTSERGVKIDETISRVQSQSSWFSPPVPEPSKIVEDTPQVRMVRTESVYTGTIPISQKLREFQSKAGSLSPSQVASLVQDGHNGTENHKTVTEDDRRAFLQEFPCQREAAPSARSRGHIDEEEFECKFPSFTANLEHRLRSEMLAFGVDPAWQRLSDAEYATAIDLLKKQRKQKLRKLPKDQRGRFEFLRKTLSHHLQQSLPAKCRLYPDNGGTGMEQTQPQSEIRRYRTSDMEEAAYEPGQGNQDSMVGPLAEGLNRRRRSSQLLAMGMGPHIAAAERQEPHAVCAQENQPTDSYCESSKPSNVFPDDGGHSLDHTHTTSFDDSASATGSVVGSIGSRIPAPKGSANVHSSMTNTLFRRSNG